MSLRPTLLSVLASLHASSEVTVWCGWTRTCEKRFAVSESRSFSKAVREPRPAVAERQIRIYEL